MAARHPLPASRGEGAECAARAESTAPQAPPHTTRATSRPGVAAAVEEAVLVVVRGGLAVRLDGGDLGERGLHRGALADGVEPAREVWIVLPIYALGVVVARPWGGRDAGDGVLLAAEVGPRADPGLQH